MNKELEFAKTLEEVKKLAKYQQNVVSREQVIDAFAAIGIEGDRLEPVFSYLDTKNIGIGSPVDTGLRLTGEEKNYLAEYEETLKEFPVLTEGQKRAYTIAAMAGEKEGKDRLFENYLPQVVDMAKLYIGQGVLLEDLIGEGNLALATGMEMLGCLEDPAEADGMLGKMMMDAMEDYIRENAEAQKSDFALANKVNDVREAAKELAEALHKKITVEELAAETGIDEEEIREAIRLSGDRIEFFEA